MRYEMPYRPAVRPPINGQLGCWFYGILGLLVPVFLCGVIFVVYLLFPPAPLNILVMGLDARPGEGNIARTDSVMLLNISPARLQVSMLSIPRDLHLDTPGYGLQRINAINVLGEMEGAGRGVELLQRAIEANFDIEVNRYMRLNFDGFARLIDAVGGVVIDVPRAIVDTQYPLPDGSTTTIRFEPGVQHMDGARALAYARTRYTDDDYQRAGRQQQVVLAFSRQLINPLTWPSVLLALNQAVETDLNVIDFTLMLPTVAVNVGRFERLVIDREWITATASGAAIPNYAALRPWIDAHLR